jgi:hypothetical protein
LYWCKVFKKQHLARLGWPGRGVWEMLVLDLPPASIVVGVSRGLGLVVGQFELRGNQGYRLDLPQSPYCGNYLTNSLNATMHVPSLVALLGATQGLSPVPASVREEMTALPPRTLERL